ncbi:MAG TPA: hypothetical protein VG325_18110 [Solirubrobacteraceae bacterium]|nr:hypothetical protein [Solirubrobacteraceae bacterium]
MRRVLLVQGGYYVATGLLPFLSRRAFETLTGPKEEWWLVQTVSGLVLAIGGGLLCAAVEDSPPRSVVVVAAGSAVTLAGIDLIYAGNRRIAPTYLIDAGAEAGIAAALLLGRPSRIARP